MNWLELLMMGTFFLLAMIGCAALFAWAWVCFWPGCKDKKIDTDTDTDSDSDGLMKCVMCGFPAERTEAGFISTGGVAGGRTLCAGNYTRTLEPGVEFVLCFRCFHAVQHDALMGIRRAYPEGPLPEESPGTPDVCVNCQRYPSIGNNRVFLQYIDVKYPGFAHKIHVEWCVSDTDMDRKVPLNSLCLCCHCALAACYETVEWAGEVSKEHPGLGILITNEALPAQLETAEEKADKAWFKRATGSEK